MRHGTSVTHTVRQPLRSSWFSSPVRRPGHATCPSQTPSGGAGRRLWCWYDGLGKPLARLSWRARPMNARLLTAGFTAIGMMTLVVAVITAPPEIVVGTAVGAILIVIGLVIVRVVSRFEEPWIQRLIICAFLLKFVGALVRYDVAFGLYGGSADAVTYHNAGTLVAAALHSGDPLPLPGSLVGSNFVRLVTGLAYSITSPTMIGGFILFSWIGFWGLLLFYRAFRLSIPAGNHRRYAVLVFLLPSLLFWPSSIGKDALMTLGLGLCAYGAANFLAGRIRRILPLIAGLGLTVMIRPHVTLTVVVALSAALVLAGRPSVPGGVARGRLMPLALSLLAMGLVLGQAQRFLGADEVSVAAANAELLAANRQSEQGGSSYDAVSPRSVAQIPIAIVTVLFRPLAFEAHNPQALVASLEGTFLLYLVIVHRGSLRRAQREACRHPYVAMAICYTILFCVAFANLGNFGIIARQRVQVLPFALVLLCLTSSSRALRQPPQLAAAEQLPSLKAPSRVLS